MTDNWNGVPGSPCEHRSVGPRRAWCLTCWEWCYRAPGHCAGCEDTRQCEDAEDDVVSIARSVLVRWAQNIHDEIGLDAIVKEIGAILGGEQ